jgi:hypothetical protein
MEEKAELNGGEHATTTALQADKWDIYKCGEANLRYEDAGERLLRR